jgi:uncharacterized membrane protein (UPF0127 family)
MLFNKTKQKKLMDKVRIADTPWAKLKGLMFENASRFDYALVFPLPRESVAMATIHMLFVFFPIDVVYLDRSRRVVDIAAKLQPFTPGYAPKKPSKFFIELPAGKSAGISLGDALEW